MPSIGHIAVGMASGRAYTDDPRLARKAMVAFSIVSILPDADAVGLLLGIPYGASLGHRGASHSLVVALFFGLASYVFAERRGLPPRRTALFTAVTAASHGLLDTLTYGGGYGCALLWPFSDHRFWSPVRFIPIAPIGAYLLSPTGLRVMATELLIFAPFWLFALMPRRARSGG